MGSWHSFVAFYYHITENRLPCLSLVRNARSLEGILENRNPPVSFLNMLAWYNSCSPLWHHNLLRMNRKSSLQCLDVYYTNVNVFHILPLPSVTRSLRPAFGTHPQY